MTSNDHAAIAHYAEILIWVTLAANAPGIAVLGVLLAGGIRLGWNRLRPRAPSGVDLT